jgi:leader peptidase (prepilin peptidase)/N-methyltransferase
MIEGVYLVGGLWVFALGTVVGSFVNVCVYRLPWQKSVIWPGSHCPKCQSPILARDNVPVLGWLVLRGACRRCGLSISARYPLVELLTGGVFAATFVTDVVASPAGILNTLDFVRLGYHLILVTLLLVALLIDAELLIIPDEVTVTGMVLGLGIGALMPGVRPAPAEASTMLGGLTAGLIGWAVGGGLVWAFRFVAGAVFRREAMGFGDVTLLAMIGAFLGWQAAVLTFFLAPFFGLGVAVWKLGKLLRKKLAGLKTKASEHEMPFGPYLSMAALMLLLLWPWIWEGWAKGVFASLAEFVHIIRFLLGL